MTFQNGSSPASGVALFFQTGRVLPQIGEPVVGTAVGEDVEVAEVDVVGVDGGRGGVVGDRHVVKLPS